MQPLRNESHTLSIRLEPAEVRRVIQDVFRSMLGLQLEVEAHAENPLVSGRRKVLASIGITGDWNGAVILECCSQTACMVAGAVLGCDPYSSVDEDVRDVMGELANIIAGNVKKMFPGNSYLTLPTVIEGADYSMQVLNGEEVLSQRLLCQGHGFIFSLILQESNGHAKR